MLGPMSDTPKDLSPLALAPEATATPQVFAAATTMFAVKAAAPTAADAAAAPIVSLNPERVWHVVLGAGQEGPLTPQELLPRLRAGQIGPQTLVWRASMPSWGPMADVPALAALWAEAAGTQPTAPQPVLAEGELSAAANAALGALMAADADHLTAAAPIAPPLAQVDLFGSDETRTLQLPSPTEATSAVAAPHGHSAEVSAAVAAALAAPPLDLGPTVPPQPAGTAPGPKTRSPIRLPAGRRAWGLAVAVAVAVAGLGGWWLMRTPAAPISPAAAPLAPAAQVAPVRQAAPATSAAAPPPAAAAAPSPAAARPAADDPAEVTAPQAGDRRAPARPGHRHGHRRGRHRAR